MSDSVSRDDPRPSTPVLPAGSDCCCGGCGSCVFDAFQRSMESYRQALRTWEEQRGSTRPA